MSAVLAETVAALGPITQLAYVVRDLPSAMKLWTDIGVGPFFLTEHLPLEGKRYRGQPTDFDMSAAITYWGDMQVEIITQHNDAPSVFKDWYERGGSGIHHICISVDDIKSAMDTMRKAGGVLVHEHEFSGAAEAVYFELQGQDTIFELVSMSPALKTAFARIKQIANNWDGSDPVRTGLPD